MIAKAAGPQLQQECSQKAPVRLGDVAVTGPGDLKCKNVFHIVVCNYDGPGGKAEKVDKHFLCKHVIMMMIHLYSCTHLNKMFHFDLV